MEVHGKRYLDAFISCDGRTLYGYTHPEEIRSNGYTPAKMSEVCRAIVAPVLKRYPANRGFDISVDEQPSVIAKLQATDGAGHVIRWGVQLYTTQEGVKGEFLRPALYAKMQELAAREGVTGVDYRLLARASNQVLQENGPLLDRLGFKKFPLMELKTATLKTTDLDYHARRYAAIVASDYEGVTARSWGPWSDADFWGPSVQSPSSR